jgi:hypothetical protein
MSKYIDITNAIPADREFFSGFRPGDWVCVDWPKRLVDDGSKHCYGAAGEVVYVGRDYLTLRGIHGFTFCVSRADVLEGAVVRIPASQAAQRRGGRAGDPLLRAVFG